MKCNHIIELLPLYLLDELSATQQKTIDEHLINCPGCAEQLDQLKETFNLLENRPAEKMSELQKVELENQLLKLTLLNKSGSNTGYLRKALLVAASIAIFIIGFSTQQIYRSFYYQPRPLQTEEYNLPENFQPTFSQKLSPTGLMVIAKGKKALAEAEK